MDSPLLNNRIGLLIWKSSNLWQSKIRKALLPFKISINEYLIIQAIKYLLLEKKYVYQNEIANLTGIDISVVSVKLKMLEKKKIILRSFKIDNRKKIIEILRSGEILFDEISPLVDLEEHKLFNKLNNESFNFINSLKLLLGKKIRIKAENKFSYDRK